MLPLHVLTCSILFQIISVVFPVLLCPKHVGALLYSTVVNVIICDWEVLDVVILLLYYC